MKKASVGILLLSLVLLCACGGKTQIVVPETHPIPYDAALDTLDDADGADAFDHSLDHADSAYYIIRDYYNLRSEGSLHILSGFQTYQQTTEYSCGCAAALMVLHYFGNDEYNELELCELLGTDTEKGTTVEGVAEFFTSIGVSRETAEDDACKIEHDISDETFQAMKRYAEAQREKA